jgi:trimeric autotransporter adhesin
VIWNHGNHSWRWGFDFRRIELNSEADSNPRGQFIFTGVNTAQMAGGQPVANTGYDFADFLLGLPQQTTLATALNLQSTNTYHFRGNSWDAYAQDEWKLRGNLTLNLGVRWEYVSPFSELNNRISNLILSPAVLDPSLGTPTLTQVLAGQGYPATLVRPNHNNFAPRIGIAWKPFRNTVVRTGYGINYNTGAFQTIASKLAFQPPFANTETNVQSAAGALTLQNGFPTPPSGLITNSYAVDPNYRLGYVQLRFLDIQQQIRPTLLLNLDYTGSKGTHLDDEVAPNSPITGIRIPTAQAFIWQTAQGYSSANSAFVRLRKRLQHGVSLGGTYTFSKVMDDVSSIGGGGFSVAQDPFNLAAERGLSSLNQPQKFTADYLWELPFGHDRRWLAGNSPWRAILGDWTWSGDWTIADGRYFTPTELGNFGDVNRGTNGLLRADVVPGQPVAISNPSISEWFNTAAFVVPPAGQYGNARRNSIEGPGQVVFDMSFNKVIQMKENRSLEIRASASNVFNHPNFSTIDTTVNSPTFGEVVGAGAMRTITLTARFRF